MNIKKYWKRSDEERLFQRLSLFCFADDDDDGDGGSDDDNDDGDDDEVKDLALNKVTKNNKKLTGELKDARARLREFEALEDERKADEAKREEEEARKEKDFEKLEKGLQTRVEEAEMNAFEFQSKYENLVVDLALTKALDKENVDPELRDAGVALLRANHNFEVNEDGEAEIDEQPLGDFIKGWAVSDGGKRFVLNGSSGSGSQGSGSDKGSSKGKNPWKPGEINLTEQMRIYKEDPTSAKTMAAEYGVEL